MSLSFPVSITTICFSFLVAAIFSKLPPSPPPFSWNTIPLFIHAGNQSGPLNDTAAKYMASFPMSTIEKMQDDVNHVCSPSSTKECEEDRIIFALQQIHSWNNNTRTIFYLNSMLNYKQYNLSTQFLGDNEKYLLHDDDGNVVWYTQCNPSGPNTTIFDLSQNQTRQFWIDTIRYALTKIDGVVDGAFVDKADTNLTKSCARAKISQAKAEAWNRGHVALLQDTMSTILSVRPDRGILIANNADIAGVNSRMFENFRYDDTWSSDQNKNDVIALMNEHGKRVIQVHSDGDLYSAAYNQSLAGYLIGAREYTYYACSQGWTLQDGWDTMWQDADYSKPLGSPLGNATFDDNTKIYSRTFQKGVQVWLDIEWEHPCIKWSDGSSTGLKQDCDKYTRTL